MNTTDTSRKGDIAELIAVTWLLEQGYEVFRNVGCTGKIDLVAVKDGEIRLIDVKTVIYRMDHGELTPGANKAKKGVERLLVDIPTHKVSWRMIDF